MALVSCSTPALTWSLNTLFSRAVGGEVTIGRSPDCTLMITTESLRVPQGGAPLMLSRNHAKLAVRDGHLQLWDCGSVNGTWVNTQQIERGAWKVVHDGDVLTFGGPPEIKQSGVLQPNPWRFRVRSLHEFLASYTPTQHLSGPSPVAALQPAPVEVFRFNNGAAPAAAAAPAPAAAEGSGSSSPSPKAAAGPLVPVAGPSAAAATAGPSVPVAGPSAAAATAGPAGGQDPTQEFFRFGSSPALAVAVPGAPPDDAVPEQGSPPASLQDAPMPPLQALQQPGGLQHPELLLQPPLQGAASEPEATRPAVLAVRADRGQNAARTADAAARGCPLSGNMQQAPAPGVVAGDADVIDLTLDEDSPVVSPQRRRIPASLRPGASAAAAAQHQQEVVVLAESPPKRRDHDALQRQGNQLKRAKPSGDTKPAYIKVEAAGPSSAAAAAGQPADAGQQETAAAAGQAAAAAAGSEAAAGDGADTGASSDLLAIQSQCTCAICQEMVVHCVTMVPCGHMFCGECLASWLENKKDCPTCRQMGTAPPVWVPGNDSICNDVLERKLSAEDKEERRRRKQSWEENKASLEQKLKVQWEPRTSGRGAAGRQRAGGSRGGGGGGVVEADPMLGYAGVLQMMLGGGPMLFAAGLQDPGGHWEQPAMHDTRSARRGPQIRDAMPPLQPQRRAGFQPPPPLAPPPQARHHFRVDYSAPRSQTPCTRCLGVLNNNVLRITVTSPPSGRRGSSVQRHYHLDCVPPHYWVEMRGTGVENMRSVSASDQALLRMRQQTAR